MKYLCMVIVDEKKLNAMSDSERRKLDSESLAYDDTLRKAGHLLAAQALQGIETATTIRHNGGKISVTDGPFAETNEQIGGFVLIEACDLDEAIRLASNIPPMRLGCVEVRPIMELTPNADAPA